MEPEIQTFIITWLIATASLIFCHQFISTRAPQIRLLIILPVIYLLTALPLRLSIVHLAAPTIFYLVWLGNFKLILFSFNQPPLCTYPPLPLLHFISIGMFPIKQRNTIPNKLNHSSSPDSVVVFVTKCLLLSLIVFSYQFRNSLHPHILLCLYCCHVYLSVELLLAITAVPVRAFLGLEIEPQFNEPYLATSLQDFWGRRWNLMVTSILRPTVYHPVRRILDGGAAILATFVVSGLMHELIYYYLMRVSPTWEVTWFFVLHGFCVAVEVAVKKAVSWTLPVAVSRILTLGFVVVTGGWLFFPQVIRNGLDLKAIEEYSILARFIRKQLRIEDYSHSTL